MLYVAVLAYCAWAIYAGWKLLNGRFDLFEREGAGYKIREYRAA